MLIVVMMGNWSDDSGDDVCCSVVFDTLVGVLVFCGPSC